MALPRQYVEAPPVTPLPFGLFSVATVTPDDAGQWAGGGVQYEPASCGEANTTVAACFDAPDLGTLTVAVSNARLATLDVNGNPAGTYTINWGDGTDPVDDTTPDAATHTYTADGTYQVTLTGPDGYSSVASVPVVNGQATPAVDGVFGKTATEGIPVVGADAFVLYNLFSCRMPGSYDRGLDRAREALRLGEQRGAERALSLQLAADDGAVTLGGATAVHPITGLALLEQYAAQNYGGVPTIHAPRGIATLLAALGGTERVGTHLETKLGSMVSAGGGYALTAPGATTDPADGTAWMYVTGQVVVRRAPVIDVTPTPRLSPADNSFVALAERPYAITTECVVAGVLVRSDFDVPVPA